MIAPLQSGYDSSVYECAYERVFFKPLRPVIRQVRDQQSLSCGDGDGDVAQLMPPPRSGNCVTNSIEREVVILRRGNPSELIPADGGVPRNGVMSTGAPIFVGLASRRQPWTRERLISTVLPPTVGR